MDHYKPVLQPQDVPERFREAWNRYDPDGIANLFFDNADFINEISYKFKEHTLCQKK